MSDYSELKRLAEACGDLNWRAIQENWTELAIRDDHGYIATMRTKSGKHAGPCPDREAKAKFLCAVSPAAVLTLIAEVGALRKDKDRLDALEVNGWDIRNSSNHIADTGDHSSTIEIVGHWMGKPFERVIGENYSENLRAAIDQAMTADAYPPARPEYEEEEQP